MAETKTFRIILRNDSTENWSIVGEANVLFKGEVGIEFLADGTAKMKVGDGTSVWNDLPYVSNGEAGIDAEQLEAIYVALATNAAAIEELKNSDSGASSETVAALQEQVNTNTADIEVLKESSFLMEEIVAKVEANTIAVENLENRTDSVEDSMDRVDYLISELTNASDLDVAAEVIQMRVDNAGNQYTTANARVSAVEYKVQDLSDNLSDYIGVDIVNDLSYEKNVLQLMAGDKPIGNPVTIVGGGGTGGGGTYTISLTNLLNTRIFSVTKNDQVILKFKYTSEDEDGYADGAGVGTLTIGGARRASFQVSQGDNEFDVTSYLSTGENIVAIKVANSEGSSRTLSYTVNVVALNLTTSFATMGLYQGPVGFQYRVTGIGDKQIYFYLDDRQIGTETITADDVTRTFNIETQSDGPHFLRVYVESTSEGVTVTSNTLNIGLMWYSTSTVYPMVMINYNDGEKMQGETITMPYLVYDPYNNIADITYNIYNEDGSIFLTTSGQVDASGKEWITQNYPAGQIKFEIVCQGKSDSTTISVVPSSFDSTIIADSLALEFTAQNRSNTEANPEYWAYEDIEATFKNFGWTGADGWITDKDGHAVLRFLPGNEMFIPFLPFVTDIRSTGYTIELELATHNVRDYDTTILASYEGNRGIIVKSQNAIFSSEQSNVGVQFKEDSRVRLTFIVTQGGSQLIYIYINGILCGTTPYSASDNFKQPNPVGITIGAEDCGLDLYVLRFYNRTFTIREQLNNFICDRSTIAERIETDKRNDLLDELNTENEDDIVLSFEKVKGVIPVLIMECPELPQYKGDKKTGMSIQYIDQLNPEYSFTAEDCQFDVQGTSSAGYPVKNFKIKLKSGLTYTASGETADGWLFDKENSIETKVFCLKADYASSEHANNVCLVDFYEDTCPYRMPPQEIDSRVRQGVNGKPIMVFWRNTDTDKLICQGCYNMNDDKSNEKTFGFVDVDITSIVSEPRIECWEWCNNNNALCLFQDTAAFDEIKYDEDGKPYPAWQDDLEPRYPDLDEMYNDLTAIRPMIEWVVSTDTTQATGETFETPIKLNHYLTGISTTYSADTAEYRLAKFKAEFEDHFILNAMLYYYLFTEVFLMIDNRAKNMFLTTFDGQHWFPIPYDMDTAMGINNEGALVFDYNLEDTEQVDGSDVYNGQQSVLWINVRQCYVSEIRSLYKELRSNNAHPFSFDAVSEKINSHQEAWPEMCWNFDAQFKYLDVFEKGTNNLAMLQGNKRAQRDWWLYNAFKYRDSKYQAGDAVSSSIHLRLYEHGEIKVTPYSHIYARVQFGNAKDTTIRVNRDETAIFSTEGIAKVNDLETHIYSPDRIVDLGDLSSLKIGYCEISAANKLQRILLGSSTEGYTNGNLKDLLVGANELLREVDVSNCYNLGTADTTSLDFSGCPCLEILRANGTVIASAEFSNGGRLKEIYLPETITALVLRNQKNIEVLDIAGYDNISTVVLENIPNIKIEDLIAKTGKLDRVRIVGAEWTATDESTLLATVEKLAACDGLSADGNTTLVDNPIVTGRVHINSITDDTLEYINDVFPELVVVVNGIAKFFVRYNDWNNDFLYRYIADEGTDAIEPVSAGKISAPVREDTEDTKSVWLGWSELPINIKKPYNIVATYDNTYRVLFLDDNGIAYESATQWIKDGESALEPVEAGLISAPVRNATQQYKYTWIGWDRDYNIITAPSDFKPIFEPVLQTYNVWFFNDAEELENIKVAYGSYAAYSGDTNAIVKKINGVESPYYTYIGWDKDPATTQIVDNTRFYAQFFFDGYIEDSWQQIAEAAAKGNIEKYGLGGRKYIEYTIGTTTSTVEAEIVGINHDTLATTSDDYNSGSSVATYSFILKDLGNNRYPYNTEPKIAEGTNQGTHYNGGGWELSDLRTWLNDVLLPTLPVDLQNVVKPVVKISDRGFYAQELNETIDRIWIPSDVELNYENDGVVTGQGTPYPIYTDMTSRKKKCDEDITLSIYWSRSTSSSNQNLGRYITTDGALGTRGCALNSGIAWGFCI